MNQIKFFIINFTRLIIESLLSIIPRDKKIIVMGSRVPKLGNKKEHDFFMHNTKYLFLYLNSLSDCGFKVIYLCDDEDMLKTFYEKGYKNVYKRNSLKGIFYMLRAKYWLFNNEKITDISWGLSGGATTINFFHGIPAKVIGYDQDKKYQKRSPLLQFIQRTLNVKSDWYVVNGEYDQACFETAFLTPKESVKILGSPRTDVFFNELKNEDIFMEDDYDAIKNLKNSGKFLIFYIPTFRNNGKDVTGWLKTEELKAFLRERNAVIVCKLHYADKNTLTIENSDCIYKMNPLSDIHSVLKFSDALVTDFSSISFDYLLLDKPIVYINSDLDEFNRERGMYAPFEELTAGITVSDENGIFSALDDVINGTDNYKEERKVLRNKLFLYHDGKNCERVLRWLESL